MITIKTTEIFDNWFNSLRDVKTKAVIDMRLARLQQGNFGDYKSIGDSVFELRFYYGAGYRIYFINNETEIVILLCGGDKSSQIRDIKMAKSIAKEILK